MKHTIKEHCHLSQERRVGQDRSKAMTHDVSWALSARQYQRLYSREIKGEAHVLK
ncbi:hypothetical protein PO124_17990 [Bacillus licheniformis]|nr:hypothetical protein [Bacillus licheniformis]